VEVDYWIFFQQAGIRKLRKIGRANMAANAMEAYGNVSFQGYFKGLVRRSEASTPRRCRQEDEEVLAKTTSCLGHIYKV
jgi:hypothetical protein